MTDPEVAIVGVVGAGTMGAGIAQVAIEAGCEVVLHDVDHDAIHRARDRIADGLSRRAAKLELDADSIEAWVDGRMERLRDSVTLDGIAAEADLVIEAVVEDIAAKRSIARTLDAAADPGTILATNTSSLSVAAIASVATRPDRVLGLHFFSPAPLMPLVEVVTAPQSDPSVVERAVTTMTAWGKVPIRCGDTPGFIVNRVNRPFTLEALAILESGSASIEEIDAAVCAAGYPLGPFELMDLTGLDVTTAASRAIHDAMAASGERLAERFAPSPIQERMVEEGRLGRKTGRGFYAYDEDGRAVATDSTSAAAPIDPTIAERVTLAIVNEAYRALDDEVATSDDIDLAMRLGVRHPQGPFERSAAMGGPAAVVTALERYRHLGPRFEPAAGLLRPTIPR